MFSIQNVYFEIFILKLDVDVDVLLVPSLSKLNTKEIHPGAKFPGGTGGRVHTNVRRELIVCLPHNVSVTSSDLTLRMKQRICLSVLLHGWLKVNIRFMSLEDPRLPISPLNTSLQETILCQGEYSECFLYRSLGDDGIVEHVLHRAGGCAFLQLRPEAHTALLQQVHGHLLLEGND